MNLNTKPNIVVIYCDDLGYGDLSCYGSQAIHTPNLDRLANQGVRFTNWYSNSPVCSPSRASLLTGLYPARAGVEEILGGKRGTVGLPRNRTTLAARLKKLGYQTGLFGKWHLGVTEENGPNRHGFDEFFGFLAGCVDYYSHIFYWGQAGGVNPVHDLWHNKAEVWQNGRYMTELITERAVDFIHGHTDDPFFLYVPYNAPHYPMHAPQKYLDRFPDLPKEQRIMAAMISAMDDGVGCITKALDEIGKLEDTIVFFSSDNGPSTESRNFLDGTEDLYYGGSAGIFRGHKGSLFDGGIREPAILSYPRAVPGGQVCDQVGMMMDVVPTILELIGAAVPESPELDGVSLATMVQNQGESPHQDLYWAYSGQLAMRRGDWKLVLNGKLDFSRAKVDDVHLSNLLVDPGERNNLAAEQPDLVAELTQAVQNWYTACSGEPARCEK